MKYILFALTIIFITTLSCTNTTEPVSKEFINTIWKLESFEIANDTIIKPPDGQIYTIKFLSDSTFEGTNACNKIGGKYELLPNSIIVIKKLGTTYAYCPDGTVHDEYYGALNDLRSHEAMYEIKQNKLYINYGVNSRMIFISQ